MENQDSLFEDISAIAEQFKAMYDRAIIAYAPLADDLCSRTASEKEVDWILTWLLDYTGEERMLKLFKRVCRAYWQVYPEVVAFYILEYRKEYDPESLKGTKYEYLIESSDDNL